MSAIKSIYKETFAWNSKGIIDSTLLLFDLNYWPVRNQLEIGLQWKLNSILYFIFYSWCLFLLALFQTKISSQSKQWHTLTVTPGSPPCLVTVNFREPQFSKHWYSEGSNSILMVWGSSAWAWVSWLLTTYNIIKIAIINKVKTFQQWYTCRRDQSESYLASLVGSVFLEDVTRSDHHPGGLDPVKGSAFLLLHQDLLKKAIDSQSDSLYLSS